MYIQTKFDIGQTLYWLENGKDGIQSGEVIGIGAEQGNARLEILYLLKKENKETCWHNQKWLFGDVNILEQKVDWQKEEQKTLIQMSFIDKVS